MRVSNCTDKELNRLDIEASRLGVAGVRIEQLLAVDLIAGDIALSFRGYQPINELLSPIPFDGRVLLRIHQHDAILVEKVLIALNDNHKIALVLECEPRSTIREHVRVGGRSRVEGGAHTLANLLIPGALLAAMSMPARRHRSSSAIFVPDLSPSDMNAAFARLIAAR